VSIVRLTSVSTLLVGLEERPDGLEERSFGT
jgi:hypothetical protein